MFLGAFANAYLSIPQITDQRGGLDLAFAAKLAISKIRCGVAGVRSLAFFRYTRGETEETRRTPL